MIELKNIELQFTEFVDLEIELFCDTCNNKLNVSKTDTDRMYAEISPCLHCQNDLLNSLKSFKTYSDELKNVLKELKSIINLLTSNETI